MNETFITRRATGENVTRAAVVFSSVNANGFSFFKLFEQFSENLHRIYIRDPFDQWYDQGVSEEIPSWDALLRAIDSVLEELDVKQVMTFGSSMGGYASLRVASHINPHICIAISPQTILDNRLPHTPKTPVAEANRDLALYLNGWQPKNAAIFFGAADFVDIYNVFRINWQGADLFPIKGQDHLVAQYLLSKRVLLAIVNDFVLKGTYTPNLRIHGRGISLDRACFDDVQLLMITRIVEGFYRGGDWNVLKYTRALKALNKWADGLHLEAKQLAQMGRLDNARLAAERAFKLAPSSVTISDSWAAICRQAGDTEAAIIGYRRSLGLRSKHYHALCCLGELLFDVGKTKEAIEMLRQAAEVRPRREKAQAIAERLGLKLAE